MTVMGHPINLRDYEALARDRLSKGLYDWYAGGAADDFRAQHDHGCKDTHTDDGHGCQ